MDPHRVPTVGRQGYPLDVYSSMLADGIVFVNSAIDQQIAGLIMASLLEIYTQQERSQEPKIYLNTRHGELLAALSVTDVIDRLKRDGVTVHTAGFGEIGVAAALIIAAGSQNQRKVAANSYASLYLGIPNLELDNITNPNTKAIQSENVKTRFRDLMSQYTKLDHDDLRTKSNVEEYFDAEQVIEFGIADQKI